MIQAPGQLKKIKNKTLTFMANMISYGIKLLYTKIKFLNEMEQKQIKKTLTFVANVCCNFLELLHNKNFKC